MAHAVAFVHELEPMLARATVLVVGPGLGRGPVSYTHLTLPTSDLV